MEEIREIFDRTFKRIFSLSNAAILSLINGLFGTNYAPDSSLVYANREAVDASLKRHFADVFLVVNNEYHYHLEAQIYSDSAIVMRVFEYGFYHALESRPDGSFQLNFPEPVVIYLVDNPDIPSDSILQINFSGQGSFDYHVRNFVYPRQTLAELEQKKLIVLIPFQMLRLRAILYDCRERVRFPSQSEFQQLKEIIASDIMENIKTNLSVGNITYADAAKLIELTNNLYEQIILHYQKRGGDQTMGVMLPGAIELPHDDIIFKLERLEELEEKNAAMADEIAALSSENEKLKAYIAQLKASK